MHRTMCRLERARDMGPGILGLAYTRPGVNEVSRRKGVGEQRRRDGQKQRGQGGHSGHSRPRACLTSALQGLPLRYCQLTLPPLTNTIALPPHSSRCFCCPAASLALSPSLSRSLPASRFCCLGWPCALLRSSGLRRPRPCPRSLQRTTLARERCPCCPLAHK